MLEAEVMAIAAEDAIAVAIAMNRALLDLVFESGDDVFSDLQKQQFYRDVRRMLRRSNR